jgi:hypothetical protein
MLFKDTHSPETSLELSLLLSPQNMHQQDPSLETGYSESADDDGEGTSLLLSKLGKWHHRTVYVAYNN